MTYQNASSLCFLTQGPEGDTGDSEGLARDQVYQEKG